jgi:hypothetical protein
MIALTWPQARLAASIPANTLISSAAFFGFPLIPVPQLMN